MKMDGYLYILQSQKSGRYYTGSASDPDRRLSQHNSNGVKSTRNKGPWNRVALIRLVDLQQAKKAEQHIKKQKSRKIVESVIKNEYSWPETIAHLFS